MAIVQNFPASLYLTPNVDDERGLRADEGEHDENPACGGVSADQVSGPVLHVSVDGRLDEHLLLWCLVHPPPLERRDKQARDQSDDERAGEGRQAAQNVRPELNYVKHRELKVLSRF